MKRILVLTVMCLLLVSGCATSKVDPNQLFLDVYMTSTELSSYHATSDVSFKSPNQDYDFNYLMDVEKGGSETQEEDVVYFEFNSDVENPYHCWALGSGRLFTDTGSNKNVEVMTTHLEKLHILDRGEQYLKLVEDLQHKKEGNSNILTAKVNQDNSSELLSMLRQHLFFDTLMLDIFGPDGIQGIILSDVSIKANEKKEIEEMSLLGKNKDDIFTYDISIKFSNLNNATVAAYDENEFLFDYSTLGIVGEDCIIGFGLKDNSKYDLYIDRGQEGQSYMIVYDRNDPNGFMLYGFVSVDGSEVESFHELMESEKHLFAEDYSFDINPNGYKGVVRCAHYEGDDSPFGYMKLDDKKTSVLYGAPSDYEQFKEVLQLIEYRIGER